MGHNDGEAKEFCIALHPGVSPCRYQASLQTSPCIRQGLVGTAVNRMVGLVPLILTLGSLNVAAAHRPTTVVARRPSKKLAGT